MAGIERGYRLGAGQHAVAGKDVDERLAVQRSRVKVEQRSDLGVGVQQTRIRQRFRRHARAVGVAKPRKAIVERQLIEGNGHGRVLLRSEEHTSELQSLMRTSYAVICLKKKNITTEDTYRERHRHKQA